MNNRKRAEILIARLNKIVNGKDEVHWNTPRSFHLESYMPGNRRIYSLTRNTVDESGACNTLVSGTAGEVCSYIDAIFYGLRIAQDPGILNR